MRAAELCTLQVKSPNELAQHVNQLLEEAGLVALEAGDDALCNQGPSL